MDYVLWYCARVMAAIKVWQIVLSILLGFHGAEYSCTHISKNFDHTHRRKRTDSPSFDQTNHRLVKACFGCLFRLHSISTQLLDLNCSTMWTFVLHLAFKWWSANAVLCVFVCASLFLFPCQIQSSSFINIFYTFQSITQGIESQIHCSALFKWKGDTYVLRAIYCVYYNLGVQNRVSFDSC